MPALVCDTHAAVWYLLDDPRISAKAVDVMDSVIRAGERIYVPSISLVELTYLVEKGRVPRVALERL